MIYFANIFIVFCLENFEIRDADLCFFIQWYVGFEIDV